MNSAVEHIVLSCDVNPKGLKWVQLCVLKAHAHYYFWNIPNLRALFVCAHLAEY